ncbi:MAG: Mrp/NBP35 family ATP-binding protein [Bacteroidales bacterium]|nr:Mrp/NBP35 family ATP-binding protein [Bacteroidales bacterium]
MQVTKEQVLEKLSIVQYPGKNKDLVSLGMVTELTIDGHKVSLTLTFPEAKSPFENSLKKAIEATLKLIDSSLEIEIKSNSKVQVQSMKVEKENPLKDVKNIIAVASGKGGVGKSTIAANLAIALAKTGAKVGLLDADIYGPSIPKMFNVEGQRPTIEKINGKDKINPVENYGVKVLSIGFFVNPEDPLIWRGSMATNALNQFINDVTWGELDYLLFDLPPGTGDIHLTMVQGLPVTASIVVSTPQDVALADAIKGINMFKNESINVPLLGLVENMAWFTPEELPNNKYYIFGKEGCKKLAEERNIPLLGQIPLVQSIREGGDQGTPAALDETSITGKAFKDLTDAVLTQLEIRNTTMNPTKQVEIKEGAGCSTH